MATIYTSSGDQVGKQAIYDASGVAIGTAGNPFITTANPASGASIALTSPQAALTASADTAYTFASQAKHVLIQNNSATNLNVEFDAVATAGSLLVYPNGQLLLFDIPVTVTHLYSTAATNVNGSTGSNIVLKGWA